MNEVKYGERGAYRYSWIVVMCLKKAEHIQRVVLAKLRYIVMTLEPCCRQVEWRLFASRNLSCFCHSPKHTSTTLMLSKLSRSIEFICQQVECLQCSVRQLSLIGIHEKE